MEQSYSKKPHFEGDQLLNSVTKSGHIGEGSYMYEQTGRPISLQEVIHGKTFLLSLFFRKPAAYDWTPQQWEGLK